MFKNHIFKYLFCQVGVTLMIFSNSFADTPRPQPEEGFGRQESQLSVGRSIMVATANPIASKVGFDILKKGGTAADAAVAIQLALNVVEPQSSGIGGGAFALYWNAREKTLKSYDGRETAPKSATADLFLDEDGVKRKFWDVVPGGLSVGVPGTLALLEKLHLNFGSIAWKELFKPAIDLAANGFPVSSRLVKSIKRARLKKLKFFDDTQNIFFKKDGSEYSPGEIIRNKELARTFKIISQQGSKAFYNGVIGDQIVRTVQSSRMNPGLMEESDLERYKVKERTPVCLPYRDYKICGMGPPSSGGLTVGLILGILENSQLKDIGRGVEGMHLFIEASK